MSDGDEDMDPQHAPPQANQGVVIREIQRDEANGVAPQANGHNNFQPLDRLDEEVLARAIARVIEQEPAPDDYEDLMEEEEPDKDNVTTDNSEYDEENYDAAAAISFEPMGGFWAGKYDDTPMALPPSGNTLPQHNEPDVPVVTEEDTSDIITTKQAERENEMHLYATYSKIDGNERKATMERKFVKSIIQAERKKYQSSDRGEGSGCSKDTEGGAVGPNQPMSP